MEHSTLPQVSLGLPVYNGQNFVAEAIRSILEQDFDDFELVITDNASTDRTADICQEFARLDRRIRYVRNERNLGAAANFNLAFTLSRGKYFKWCAHDDVLGAGFLTHCVRALDDDFRHVIAYPRLLGIDENGQPTQYVERVLPDLGGTSPALRFRVMVAAHGWDAAMFGLWRQDALVQTTLHEPYYGSDCALLAEMALLGTFVQAPDAILYSRDHPTRSVRLPSSERLAWQNPDGSAANAFELSRRVRHLVAIVYRHRRIVPLGRTLFHLLAWVLDPLLVARLFLEAVGVVSPQLRSKLRGAGLGALKRIHAVSDRSPG
ncbi:glycosyltransferase family 2 protein [Mesorhizobium qingshengii]|uniref:Glycosyltransferase involved in cell wall bisynthesis n=1 Tax=Mesorhizobium qingshengii TaxID=1165689 RepID=A0A1G5UZP0_9HYPH|nr:glycosyltransferase family 2 protein [Mesorhizobium qingshengii]SDA38215.1 Glycosyltransferase involved in cell wall bisynthesis [Mesorhizobium qingshengii]